MLADYRSRWLLPVIMFFMALQLTACGDKDKEQRQAFTAFLQSIQPQEERQLPVLTEQQKQSFGHYVQDYAVLTTFNRQLQQVVAGSLKPMLEQVSHIRVPQDYISQRNNLRQLIGALNLLGQQSLNAKTQADNARQALKQPEDLKLVYDKLYNRVVVKPATAMISIVPDSVSFIQSLIKVGDYLQSQGNQVVFNDSNVQFHTQQQVDQYNGMMSDLATQQQNLVNALKGQNLVASH
ncbi:DUF3053 domain-containing protein [Pectobacteriaceae bacterium CE90]|nr:DUF3053 domain-containing protein [Prodigiosinella sp. LS101]WJV54079.1 DUF3053 domain-containing protein [Prodigiosinella sp. LS101]WJV58441.1 DUF3053 domain-containing protein [Pectobacteriaceae bacterium C111]WJY14908.1 DUF3053 domain-containing protein [Pectobacteriaceae bacterium CE90]